MFSFITKRVKRRDRRESRPLRPRLNLEPLEQRSLMATAVLINGNVLTIEGTAASDVIEVRPIKGREVEVTGITSGQSRFPVTNLMRIVVNGKAGDDTIRIDPNITIDARLDGGDGDDTLFGGAGADRLFGQEGFDRLEGGTGDDQLYGGGGDDALFGGLGYDRLLGEEGNDFLDAGAAADALMTHNLIDGGAGRNFDAYRWAINGARDTDVLQKGKPNCVFMASLAALARAPSCDLASWIVYVGDGKYDVRVNDGGKSAWQRIDLLSNFDPTYVRMTDIPEAAKVAPIDVGPGNVREFWTYLFCRAYAPVSEIRGFFAADAVAKLTGNREPVAGTAGKITDRHKELIRDNLKAGNLVVFVTGNANSKRLIGNHAYTVLNIDKGGNVLLRNPWGYDVRKADLGKWACSNPYDGITQVSWADFKRSAVELHIAAPPTAGNPVPAAGATTMTKVIEQTEAFGDYFNLRVKVLNHHGKAVPITHGGYVNVARLGEAQVAEVKALNGEDRIITGLPGKRGDSPLKYEVYVTNSLYHSTFEIVPPTAAGGTAEVVIRLTPIRLAPNPSGTWTKTETYKTVLPDGRPYSHTTNVTVSFQASASGIAGTYRYDTRDSNGSASTHTWKLTGTYDDVTGVMTFQYDYGNGTLGHFWSSVRADDLVAWGYRRS